MRQRIEKHKRMRPADWATLEADTDIGTRISQKIGGAQTVIVDCITLLVNNIFNQCSDRAGQLQDTSFIEQELVTEISGLTDCMHRTDADFIIVTNEVGLGLVPDNRLGRLYRDLLGRANQMLAQAVDEVYLMVAGLPVRIKPSA